MKDVIITHKYLRENPTHIFVYGDNTLRRGKGGAAYLRDVDNTYGFITKKYPNDSSKAFYKPSEYVNIFESELKKLENEIKNNPGKTYLISKLGAGLANRYFIFENVIIHQLPELKKYDNVRLLFNI